MLWKSDWEAVWRPWPVRLITGTWGLGIVYRRYINGETEYRAKTEEEKDESDALAQIW